MLLYSIWGYLEPQRGILGVLETHKKSLRQLDMYVSTAPKTPP